MEPRLFPLEIGRFLFLPGRRLGSLLIVAKDEQSALSGVLDVFARYNAKLKHLTLSVKNSEKAKTFLIFLLIFLDVTESNFPFEEIAGEIKKLRTVKDVKVIQQQVEGFIADTVSDRLLAGGERAIIMRKTLCESFVNGVRERFGSAGEVFLYYNGLEMGINAAKEHIEIGKKLGLTDPVQICKMGATIFTAVGFGKMEIEKLTLNPPYALINVYNSFECQLAFGTHTKAYSHFLRGLIAGYLLTVLDTQIKVEEVKCAAKGDPHCVFEAKTEK